MKKILLLTIVLTLTLNARNSNSDSKILANKAAIGIMVGIGLTTNNCTDEPINVKKLSGKQDCSIVELDQKIYICCKKKYLKTKCLDAHKISSLMGADYE